MLDSSLGSSAIARDFPKVGRVQLSVHRKETLKCYAVARAVYTVESLSHYRSSRRLSHEASRAENSYVVEKASLLTTTELQSAAMHMSSARGLPFGQAGKWS